jgi:hypothetical protein
MKLPNSFIKSRNIYYIIFALFVTVFFIPGSYITAYVMQSTGYTIQSDSINVGGAPSTSTSYGLGDTAGEIGTGDSNSATYYMHAGYWQMQESYIAISSPSDLALSSMGGVSGGSSEGTTTWTVTTDNIAGYTMTINSSTNPTLTSGANSFANYVPAGADPDYTFTIAASDSEFGFSPEGSDTIARFKDNGSICNTGSSETSAKCWDSVSTTPKTFAGSTSGNHPSGTSSTVRFRAESGTSHIQPAGAYSATITITATTL